MRIIAYDDNPDYGGHQTMACLGIEALAADPAIELLFMFNPQNKKLATRLSSIPNIQTQEAPCTTQRFQGVRNRIAKSGIRALEKSFRKMDPALVLCIQGEIEGSSQAVIAARQAGIECVSYIAVPHRMAEMGAKLGRLRDRANQYLLNQPDRYIAISAGMKRLLVERGVEKPINVVPNGIPAPPAPNLKPQTANPVMGMLGRIEFNQKRQDLMVKTFLSHPNAFHDCHLLIAGNGPDEGKLEKLIAGQENITLLPWQDDTEAFYKRIDFLMLPSRFEGVPLVMLEALARGIPVIGSACDGMRDILPEAWTFEAGNAAGLASAFSEVRKTWQSEIGSVRKKVETEMTLETFKSNFHRTICSSRNR